MRLWEDFPSKVLDGFVLGFYISSTWRIIPGRNGYMVNNHGDRCCPLRIGLDWTPNPNVVEFFQVTRVEQKSDNLGSRLGKRSSTMDFLFKRWDVGGFFVR